MPVSQTSGLGGVIQLGGAGAQGDSTTMQTFVEQLMRAREVKFQQELTKMNAISGLIEATGGNIPDELIKAGEKSFKNLFGADLAQVQKTGAAIGGPDSAGTTPSGTGDLTAGGSGQVEGIFQAMAGRTRQKVATEQGDADARRRLVTAQTEQANLDVETQRVTTELGKRFAGAKTPEERAEIGLALAFMSNPSAETLVGASLPPEKMSQYIEALRMRQTGEMTPEQRTAYATEQGTANVDLFGGDLGQAVTYFGDLISGRSPSVQPTISPDFVKKNYELLGVAAELQSMGISPALQAQFIAHKGDTSKIPGWPKEIVTPQMIQAKASMISANAQATEAAEAKKRTGIMSGQLALDVENSKSESALRIANALKTYKEYMLMGAEGGPDVQNMLRAVQTLKTVADTKGIDESFLREAQRELAPMFGLAPVDVRGFFGGLSTQFVPMGLGGGMGTQSQSPSSVLRSQTSGPVAPGTTVNMTTGAVTDPAAALAPPDNMEEAIKALLPRRTK